MHALDKYRCTSCMYNVHVMRSLFHGYIDYTVIALVITWCTVYITCTCTCTLYMYINWTTSISIEHKAINIEMLTLGKKRDVKENLEQTHNIHMCICVGMFCIFIIFLWYCRYNVHII